MAWREDGAGCELLSSSKVIAENPSLVFQPRFAQLQGREFSPRGLRESPEPGVAGTWRCSEQPLSKQPSLQQKYSSNSDRMKNIESLS